MCSTCRTLKRYSPPTARYGPSGCLSSSSSPDFFSDFSFLHDQDSIFLRESGERTDVSLLILFTAV
jgi:hypothetical protein